MNFSRREFVKLGLAALPAAELSRLVAEGSPNSKFAGVQIGAIVSPYSYPSIPVAADQFLLVLVKIGLSAVEIQDVRCEVYAGAPSKPREGYSGSPHMSAEERAAARKTQAEQLRQWRLTNKQEILDRYKALRKTYDDAGVKIYAFRLANTTMDMPDAEYDYFFESARVLGANQITTELPEDPALSQRLGELGAKHKIMVGYHNHTQVNAHSWDTALAQSKWNGIQLDIGHYVTATNGSPVPFIQEHHERITSIHLKDRKYATHGGANLPWGEGDTPIKPVLLLLKEKKYGIPALVEYEYRGTGTPVEEVGKCMDYMRQTVA